jgi:hypothetical protein
LHLVSSILPDALTSLSIITPTSWNRQHMLCEPHDAYSKDTFW